MTRKSRFALLIVAASLPMIAACSESSTGPTELKISRAEITAEQIAMGCGEVIPWGMAGCVTH